MAVSTMYVNGTYCNRSIEDELKPLLLVFSSSASICSFTCLVAIGVMVCMRLFKLLTHRLIFYLLVSILVFSLVDALQFLNLSLKFWEGEHMDVCIAESTLVQYSHWVMFLATLMMTLHLTSMVLLPTHYETIAKLEPFYLLFPWSFPLLMTWIPFVHHNYGLSGPWCWIRVYNEDCSPNKEGMIEMYATWYGELFVGLILNNIALVIVGIRLCKRACSSNEISMDYRKALKQTLPLLAYPMTYQFLSSFAIANRLYQLIHKGHNIQWLFYAHAFASPSWGLFAPIFTILYLIISKCSKDNFRRTTAKCCSCCRNRKLKVAGFNQIDETTTCIVHSTDYLTRYGVTETSPTQAYIGTESDIDDSYIKVMSVGKVNPLM